MEAAKTRAENHEMKGSDTELTRRFKGGVEFYRVSTRNRHLFTGQITDITRGFEYTEYDVKIKSKCVAEKSTL